MSKSNSNPVFSQPIATYLKHLGIECSYNMNCPYRKDSDSDSFKVNDNLWYDHVDKEGGNAYNLALKFYPNSKTEAIKSLYESMGMKYVSNKIEVSHADNYTKAINALVKVRNACKIDLTIDSPASNYLKSRKVTTKTVDFFSYIEPGKLKDILSPEEIELTSLRKYEGKIILWYMRNNVPVYYCTRDIDSKEFRKAYVGNNILSNVIWNYDDLYTAPILVWGEGMFDCISLIELGYGSAGEITTQIVKEHYQDIIKAIKWRNQNHPDWKFIICLDDDALTKTGRRPGNEEAEKIAMRLYEEGLDVLWVKHDSSALVKVDINELHKQDKVIDIVNLINSAKSVSAILEFDEAMCLRNMSKALTNGSLRYFEALCNLYQAKTGSTNKEIIIKLSYMQYKWQDIYTDEIKEMFVYGPDVTVVYSKNIYNTISGTSYDVFKNAVVIKNLAAYQINKSMKYKVDNLILDCKKMDWRVSRTSTNEFKFNSYIPTDLLMQDPVPNTPLPECWNALIDNLADATCKEWLLNHMATYVQTLEKPFTVPVFLSKVGTGKTVLCKMFGEALGGYTPISNAIFSSTFNEWMMSPLVLLDEMSTVRSEVNELDNKMKLLINEDQHINGKFKTGVTIKCNNYVAIASNEGRTTLPIKISNDDRRYSIISGGKDIRIEKEVADRCEESLSDFMLYLISRPIDKRMARMVLQSDLKGNIQEQSKNQTMQVVEEFIECYKNKDLPQEVLKLMGIVSYSPDIKVSWAVQVINVMIKPYGKFVSKTIMPFLKQAGIVIYQKDHAAYFNIDTQIEQPIRCELISNTTSTSTSTTTTVMSNKDCDDSNLF